MIIDFHTHTFPDQIARRAITGMQVISHAAAFAEGTVSALRDSMAAAGITYSVILPVATNPAKLVSMNDSAIQLNGQNGIFHFGAVHPLAENWESELVRIAEAGLKGIKIHPLYQGVDINDIRYLRILGKAAELGLITVMHSGNDIGYPGQVRCDPQMTADALNQLGPIPIVLAHMGGWKNWDRVTEYLAPTGCYIDTAISLGSIAPLNDGYYSPEDLPLLSQQAFRDLVKAFGSHRVLFGTDSPWADQKTEIQNLNDLSLPKESLDHILFANACRLLNI